jgi:hypothetical protein
MDPAYYFVCEWARECENNSLAGGSIDMKLGADQQTKAEMLSQKAMSRLSTTPIKLTQIIRETNRSFHWISTVEIV